MTRIRSLASILLVVGAVVGLTGCDGDSGMAPSSMPQVVEGTVDLEPSTFDVVHVQVERDGTFSSTVNWNDANNDINTVLVTGTCTVVQILTDAAGCGEETAPFVADDESLDKPSVLTAQVTAGAHTVGLFNEGPGADTLTYRFEIN